MAASFDIKFLINRSTPLHQLQLTDTSSGFTFSKANFKITYPNGYVVENTDFTNPDISSAGATTNKDVKFDVNNKVLRGDYVIVMTAKDSSNNTHTAQRSFNFTWKEPTLDISNTSDVTTPEVKFKDNTQDYDNGNFTENITTRTISSSFPSTSAASGASAVSNSVTSGFTSLEVDVVNSGNYYEGDYTPSLSVNILYTHTNGYLTLQYINAITESFSVRRAPTQNELLTKINQYKANIDVYKTTNRSTFDKLSEQYDLVIGLYSHLIDRVDASLTDGSEPILRELLDIVEPNASHTYQSAAIVQFTSSDTEATQDIIGGMVSSNTESGLDVSYDDSTGKLNFNVDDFTITQTGDTTGTVTVTNLANATLNSTLATVNSTTGAFGSTTAIPVITVNGKGLITNVTTAAISTVLTLAVDGGGNDNITIGTDTLTISGGTGLTTSISDNNISVAIDSTVATLTGSQTLTNKTIDADNNTVSNIEVDNLKSGVLDTDLSSVAGTDTTLASAKAIKSYVDAQILTKDNTDEITEGSSNLYFTNERVDDRVNALLQAGSNVSLSYDDAANTLTISSTQLTNEQVQDVIGGMLGGDETGGISVTYDDTNNEIDFALSSIPNSSLTNSTITVNGTSIALGASGTLDTGDIGEGSNLYFTNERVDDRVNALLQAGSNVSLTYDDAANTLTIAATQLTNEQVQDIIGGMLGGDETGGISVTYDDTNNEIDFTISNVPNSSLANSSVTINGTAVSLGGSITLDTDDIGEGSSNLYYTDARAQAVSINNVVEDTTPQLGGTLDTNGNLIQFGDSGSSTDDRLQFGASQDLEIYHGTTHSFIDNNTGNLYIRNFSDDKNIHFQTDDGSGGTTDYMVINGSENIIKFQEHTRHLDNKQARFGTGSDLKIYHNGTDSYIQNVTGTLQIQNQSDDKDILLRSDDGSGGVATYFYLDGSTVLNRFPVHARWDDSIEAQFGAGADLKILHDGTNSVISNETGDIRFIQYVDDGKIRFYNDNGSGGTTEYFRVDGSAEETLFSKQIRVPDNVKIAAGGSSDLQIYHDGSHSYIQDAGTGELRLAASVFRVLNANASETMIYAAQDGKVQLRFNESTKFETTNTGISVTGTATATAFSGPLTGNVTGNVTGNLTGDVTGDVTGNLTGNVTGNATGLSGTPNITVGTISSGNITTSGYLRGPASFTIDPATHGDNTGTVVIAGNLQVDGTTTTINSTTVAIDDLNFSIATDAADSAAANGAGITIGGASATLTYTHADTSWNFNKPLNVTGNITTTGDITVSGGDITASNFIAGVSGGSVRIKNSANNTIATFTSALDTTFAGSISLADSKTLNIGTGNDLQIIHDGTNSVITNTTGNLYIRNDADDADIVFQSDDGSGGRTEYFRLDGGIVRTVFSKDTKHEDSVKAFFGSGYDLEIFHDGNSVIRNQAGDLYIDNYQDDGDIIFRSDDGTGSQTEYFKLDGGNEANLFSKNVKLSDNVELRIGSSNDLKIYHDGSTSFIKDAGTGNLEMWADGAVIIKSGDGTETKALFDTNGSVDLYYDNSKKFETTSAGIKLPSYGAGYLKTDANGNVSVDTSTIEDTLQTVTDRGSTTTNTMQGTRLGLGGAPHASAALQITTTAQHLRMYNGSELGVMHVLSGGELELWAHGEGETINFRTGSGSGVLAAHIDGTNTTFLGDITIQDSSPQITFLDTTNNTDALIYSDDTGGINISADENNEQGSSTIKFYIDGGEKARLDSSGNLGIGNTSPSQKLSVTGNIGLSGVVLFNDNQGINFGNSNAKIYGSSADGIKFNGGGSEKMRLTQAGNLAIGSTSADGKLDITQTSATDPVLRLTDDGVANYDFIFPDSSTIKLETNTSSNKTFKVLNAGSGNFNFEVDGTATTGGDLTIGGTGGIFIPEYIYHVGDTNSYFGFSSNDNFVIATAAGERLHINSSGNATFAGDVSLSSGNELTVNNAANNNNGGIHIKNDNNLYSGALTFHTEYSGTDTHAARVQAGTNGTDAALYLQVANTSKTLTSVLTLDFNLLATFAGDIKLADNKKIKGTTYSAAFISFESDGETRISANDDVVIGYGETLNISNAGVSTFKGNVNINSATGPIITLTDTDSTIGVDSIIGHIAFVGTEIGGETSRIASVSETAGGEAGLRFYTGSSVTQALQLDKDQNATFAGTLGVAGSSAVSTSALTIKSKSTSSQQSAIDIIQNGSGTNSIIRMGEKSTDGGRFHMFDSGTEMIAFYTDGTANHISAGNFGIGTNNATYKLQVQGTFYVNETAYINGNTEVNAAFSQTGGAASSFSGNVTVPALIATADIYLNDGYSAANRYLHLRKNTANDGGIVMSSKTGSNNATNDWQIVNSGGTRDLHFYAYGLGGNALTLDRENGLATFAGDITISKSVGDSVLTIEADTDNNNENDNPRIELKQDSGIIYGHFGINGDANSAFTGAGSNATYIRAAGGFDIAVSANVRALQIDTSTNAKFAGTVTVEGDHILINKANNPSYLRIGQNLADDAYVYFGTDSYDWSIGVDRSQAKFSINNHSNLTSNPEMTLDGSGNATFAGTITTDRLSLFTSNTDRATVQAGSSGTTGHLYFNSYTGTTLKQLTWSAANSGFYPQGASGSFDLGLNGNRWNRVYANYFYGDGSNLTGVTGEWDGTHTGNATIVGSLHLDSDSAQLQFGDDNDMQIYHNGADGEINNATGTFIIDAAGKIILDSADSGIVHFKNSGTLYGLISQTSSNMQIKSYVNDADMVFKGEDGGSEITALTLDMSDSGFGIFNYGVKAQFFTSDGGRGFKQDSVAFVHTYSNGSDADAAGDLGSSTVRWRDLHLYGDIEAYDSLTIDVTGDLSLDASGNDIRFKVNGVEYGKFKQDSSDFAIYSSIENKDIILRGNDGGTTIDALTLDMGEGGNAIFSGKISSEHIKYCNKSISNSYERIYFAAANTSQLATAVRLTGTSHGSNHVANFTADILVNHYQDVVIKSQSGGYTQVTLKVSSNNNGDYTLFVKSASANAATYYFKVEAISDNVDLTTLPSSTASTSTEHEHTTVFGTNRTGTGGTIQHNFADDVTVGALTSGETAQLVINHEGGASAVAKFMSRTNRAFIQVGDNDTNGYIVAEGDLLSIGRAASASGNNININASNNVGIGTNTPGSKLEVKTSGTNTVLELDNSDSNYTVTQYNAQGATKGFSGFNTSFMLFGGESGVDTRLQAGGQYGMTIRNSDRNVGIGTTDPASALTINRASGAVGILLEGNGTDVGKFKVASAGVNHAVQIGTISNNEVQFHTNDSEKMRIHQDGKVGIGSTTPSHRLQVYDATSDAPLKIESGDGYVGIKFKDPDDDDNLFYRGDITAFYFTGARLGINDSSPDYALSVNSSDTVSYAHFINSSTGNTASDGTNVGVNGLDFYIWQRENASAIIGTNGSERLRVTGDGKVGIGTSAPPHQKLTVTGSSGAADGNLTNGILSLTTGTGVIADTRLLFGIVDDDYAWIQAADYGVAYRDLILSPNGGNVGIGTTSPTQKLDVRGGTGGGTLTHAIFTGTNSRGLEIRTRSDVSGGQHSGCAEINSADSENDGGELAFSSNGNIRMFIKGDGNIGIGTTSPSAKLEISHTDTMIRMSDSDGTNQYLELGHNNGSSTYVSRNGGSEGHHVFYTSGGSAVERMRILAGGYVAIGQSTAYAPTGGGSTMLTVTRTANEETNLVVSNQANHASAEARLIMATYGHDFIISGTSSLGGSKLLFHRASQKLLEFNSSNEAHFTGDIAIPSDQQLQIGGSIAAGDLKIYRDTSSNSQNIVNKTGTLYINQQHNDGNIVFRNDDGAGGTFDYFSVDGGSTTHDGTSTTAAYTKWYDNSRIALGSGKDLQLWHDGTTSTMYNVTGNLHITCATDDSDIRFYGHDGGSSVTEYFRIDGGIHANIFSQKVGIGTASIQSGITFQVDGVSYYQGDNTTNGTAVFVADSNKGTAQSHIHYGSTGDWYIRPSSNSGKVVISDNANMLVGIGTASPSVKLEVSGNTKLGSGSLQVSTDSTFLSNYNYTFRDAVGINNPNDTSAATNSNTVMSVGAKSGGTVNTSIITTGAIGVGTSSPSQKLHVQGGGLFTGSVSITADGQPALSVTGGISCGLDLVIAQNSQLQASRNTTTDSVAAAAVSLIDHNTGSGNRATMTMEANSYQGAKHIEFYQATTVNGSISSGLNATGFNTSSDYRLKEDLKDFNGLEIASKIKMYDFKWKSDDNARSYGVMAHELQEIFPQAVSGDKDEKNENGKAIYQGVDYSKLVPVLLKSIQELEARIKELENK